MDYVTTFFDDNKNKCAWVVFNHECSVNDSKQLLFGTKFFGLQFKIQSFSEYLNNPYFKNLLRSLKVPGQEKQEPHVSSNVSDSVDISELNNQISSTKLSDQVFNPCSNNFEKRNYGNDKFKFSTKYLKKSLDNSTFDSIKNIKTDETSRIIKVHDKKKNLSQQSSSADGVNIRKFNNQILFDKSSTQLYKPCSNNTDKNSKSYNKSQYTSGYYKKSLENTKLDSLKMIVSDGVPCLINQNNNYINSYKYNNNSYDDQTSFKKENVHCNQKSLCPKQNTFEKHKHSFSNKYKNTPLPDLRQWLNQRRKYSNHSINNTNTNSGPSVECKDTFYHRNHYRKNEEQNNGFKYYNQSNNQNKSFCYNQCNLFHPYRRDNYRFMNK